MSTDIPATADSATKESGPCFADYNFKDSILSALTELGYKNPTPIQAKAIPTIIDGHDIVGLAQTGTGKTAAFALPILQKIDLSNPNPQCLVMVPTRELAIQVCKAFEGYSKHLMGLTVAAIYGGTGYYDQIKALKDKRQIIVGTPGRIMDHIRKETLNISKIETLVLDEADEMLRMGFIEDIEWILSHTPESRQTALFSATMPKKVRQMANKYLNQPKEVKVSEGKAASKNITQNSIFVGRFRKIDILNRLLQFEEVDGVIIFVRTKNQCVEVAENLQKKGYKACALNGDMEQRQRERTVKELDKGQINIIIATDVAARGLDVPRISHVFNYDLPQDIESYTHRIGRTGRAGRSGKAISFVERKEVHFIKTLQKVLKQDIIEIPIPSIDQINENRLKDFKARVVEVAQKANLSFYEPILKSLIEANDIEPIKIAAALARMLEGGQPLLLTDQPMSEKSDKKVIKLNKDRGDDKPRFKRNRREKFSRDNGREFNRRDGDRDRKRRSKR